jgi:hypothetical protein
LLLLAVRREKYNVPTNEEIEAIQHLPESDLPPLGFSPEAVSLLEPGMLNLHGAIRNNPSPDVGSQHINLSIEVREYRPWRLDKILRPYLAGN